MAMWTAQITSSERGRSDLFCSSATILVDLYDEYGAFFPDGKGKHCLKTHEQFYIMTTYH
jgi:hypothetical protein